jgi:histidyl-tRNA synthetase
VFPEAAKMKKQMGYADSNHIPYVAIVGGDEMAAQKVMLKNMLTGEQKQVGIEELVGKVMKVESL